jgi:hypothetical protein
MTVLRQAILRQRLNQLDVRLGFVAMRVGIGSQVLLALERLWIGPCIFLDLGFINPNLAFFNPSCELAELLIVVVFADSGVITPIPLVDAANQIIALHRSIGERSATVMTAAVQHGNLIFAVARIPNHDQVHTGNQGIGRGEWSELIPREYRELFGGRYQGHRVSFVSR